MNIFDDGICVDSIYKLVEYYFDKNINSKNKSGLINVVNYDIDWFKVNLIGNKISIKLLANACGLNVCIPNNYNVWNCNKELVNTVNVESNVYDSNVYEDDDDDDGNEIICTNDKNDVTNYTSANCKLNCIENKIDLRVDDDNDDDDDVNNYPIAKLYKLKSNISDVIKCDKTTITSNIDPFEISKIPVVITDRGVNGSNERNNNTRDLDNLINICISRENYSNIVVLNDSLVPKIIITDQNKVVMM